MWWMAIESGRTIFHMISDNYHPQQLQDHHRHHRHQHHRQVWDYAIESLESIKRKNLEMFPKFGLFFSVKLIGRASPHSPLQGEWVPSSQCLPNIVCSFAPSHELKHFFNKHMFFKFQIKMPIQLINMCPLSSLVESSFLFKIQVFETFLLKLFPICQSKG